MPKPRKPNPPAPDPATVYERAKPEAECGMGRLDNNKGTPTDRPDEIEKAATNRQDNRRQINSEDVVNGRAERKPHQK